MTTFSVVIGGTTVTQSARMIIYNEAGYSIVLGRAPVGADWSDIGWEYNESKRFGRKSVLRATGQKLPKVALDFVLGYTDPQKSVQDQINQLMSLANSSARVIILYSRSESGTWQVTDCSVSVKSRSDVTDEPTRASVSLTLTQVDTDTLRIGPLSGGVAVTPAPAPTPAPQPSAQPTQPPTPPATNPTPQAGKTYTVKKGDTLWAISIRYYGNGTQWTRIADANGVKNPRLLQIGTVLRIP